MKNKQTPVPQAQPQPQNFETLLAGLPEIHSLSKEREQVLAKSKTAAAKEELVLAHMREAFFYVRQVCRGRIEDGEIYSFCYKALCECARNFEPDWQRFFAYSKPNLRGNVSRYWKSLDVVKNSSMHETGDAPQCPESVYADQTLVNEDETPYQGEGSVLGSAEPEFELIQLRERLELIKPIIEKKLNEQERMVLDLTYTGGYNFETIGKMLSPAVTRSAVQQTHARALKKLRNELARQKKLS